MESAIESRLFFRVPEGFTWHETHFCIRKREAVYLHNSAQLKTTFEVDTHDFVSTRIGSPGLVIPLELSHRRNVARGSTEVCRF
jgi:hypothetical protein